MQKPWDDEANMFGRAYKIKLFLGTKQRNDNKMIVKIDGKRISVDNTYIDFSNGAITIKDGCKRICFVRSETYWIGTGCPRKLRGKWVVDSVMLIIDKV